MTKFEIGEIAIVTKSRLYPSIVGYECTIIGLASNGDDYIIDIHGLPCDYGVWTAPERNLRKRRPPQELTTWEEVQKITGWNPAKQMESEK